MYEKNEIKNNVDIYIYIKRNGKYSNNRAIKSKGQ